jgi:hypothetical protein
MTDVHDFVSDLAWSQSQSDQPWWEAVYRQAFPNLATMTCVNGDGWAQRGGIDRVLTLTSGKTLTVDEKARREHYGDILLEYWSDQRRKAKGWVAKDLACDYIAYAVVTTGLCYLLPFPQLRKAWRTHHKEWVAQYRKIEAANNGYTTVSVAVPTTVLLRALSDALVVDLRQDAA